MVESIRCDPGVHIRWSVLIAESRAQSSPNPTAFVRQFEDLNIAEMDRSGLGGVEGRDMGNRVENAIRRWRGGPNHLDIFCPSIVRFGTMHRVGTSVGEALTRSVARSLEINFGWSLVRDNLVGPRIQPGGGLVQKDL
jgi:hypothetical protein